ncbi:glycosyltransferase family 48 protein [Coniophora puteana RWD-64-598 SS2]|uniref:Glycosyltransferase family 48 protein n=1 Tax=Coniophora puteana (strain RWD-64-598) TaxID=741705 RepID=A0A5M3MMD1_CONPW|nr:glycosyltransferase family 48 protein [Coniophora puteana RWD-64-598 SS2]EIW80328.1 glycosyltransferase family 48 protein [Coniophora puteana RWD-64-598 SS2]
MVIQTFTASYPGLSTQARMVSIFMWMLIFGCKATESYWFLTFSLRDPIAVMVLRPEPLHDPAHFTLAIMHVIDFILFYLDKFLRYIIWNTVFIIGRSFMLGFTSTLKISASKDMDVRYKPKVRFTDFLLSHSMYREHLSTRASRTNSYPAGSETERRVSFFAQPFIVNLPEPLLVDAMPAFTLHPVEWDNFVQDNNIIAEESATFNGGSNSPFTADEKAQSKMDDLPVHCIGSKSFTPFEFTLRTHIWASLRAQTPDHTIKLLDHVDKPEVVRRSGGNTERLEREPERMARRNFNASVLCVIDDHSEFTLETGHRRPKFHIELPGNPILGDGKSDSQNHAVIFYRGEYLQLIDASRDNYLEEYLKLRDLFGYSVSSQSPYAQYGHKDFRKLYVVTVGAREYLFSENIGILGDLAAGKEQTFGTLSARDWAWIGGKLHYSHPDFLNALYMNTLDGVSKSQKGLYLDEDIYAGMNAFGRGARIKHTEYIQCGEGRDLGFGTTSTSRRRLVREDEQVPKREYYYLGTQLPIDRLLTFYYAHPGFHINNMPVTLAMRLFILCNLTEHETARAVVRLGSQFLSLSPLIEGYST